MLHSTVTVRANRNNERIWNECRIYRNFQFINFESERTGVIAAVIVQYHFDARARIEIESYSSEHVISIYLYTLFGQTLVSPYFFTFISFFNCIFRRVWNNSCSESMFTLPNQKLAGGFVMCVIKLARIRESKNDTG